MPSRNSRYLALGCVAAGVAVYSAACGGSAPPASAAPTPSSVVAAQSPDTTESPAAGRGGRGGGRGAAAAGDAPALQPYRRVVPAGSPTRTGLFVTHRVGDK